MSAKTVAQENDDFSGGLSVAQAASFLGVSPQRVRRLLITGRLAAKRYEDGTWRVLWPLSMRGGKRGPKLGALRDGTLLPQRFGTQLVLIPAPLKVRVIGG